MRPARTLPLALALAALAVGRAGAQAPPLANPALLQPMLPPRPVAPAVPLASPIGPGQQCRLAIGAAERAAGIPHQLMAAIGRVESGRREPDGSVDPWPWSINAEGEDHVFDTKAEAIAAVRGLQAQGMRSIDVGCMQVNLLHHPDAFASLEQAFDPVANASYAARFLVQLHDETGTWPNATAWYHSATPELGADYERRVMAVWPEEQQHPDNAGLPLTGYGGAVVGPNGPVRVGGTMILANRGVPAHIIPLPAGTVGRGLAAYRAAPIPVVAHWAPLPAPGRTPGKPG
jgi:hypothetical protein